MNFGTNLPGRGTFGAYGGVNNHNPNSQIRAYLKGEPYHPSDLMDKFIWLITTGWHGMRVRGEVPANLVKRDKNPNLSLEKFVSEYLQYFFRKDMSQMKLEEMFMNFTNRMTAEDAEILARATTGLIPVDVEKVERYAQNRRFANGAPIFQRARYDALLTQLAATEKGNSGLAPVASAPKQNSESGKNPANAGKDVANTYDPLNLTDDENIDDVSVKPKAVSEEAPKPVKRRGRPSKKAQV